MKKENTLLTIKRLDSSPYWSDDFLTSEKAHFEKLQCTYLEPRTDCDQFFDVLITNTHSNLKKLSQKERNNLKLIIHPNSGYDNFSPDILDEITAPIILGNELRANAVAETILAEILSKFSLAPVQTKWQKDRKWPRELLCEQQVLVVGFGMIGKLVAQTLQAIGANVHIFDPYKNHLKIPEIKFDLIILAASLNPSSLEMIDAHFLQNLSSKGMLVNCARGELLHMPGLLNFLNENPNASAYLDVFPIEPANFQEFKNIKNLKTSSHVAGVHLKLEEKTLSFTKKIVTDFIKLNLNDFLTKYQHINLHNRKFKNFLI